MPWTLNGINRDNPIGKAVYQYGVASYNEGFIFGCITGSIVTSLVYLLLEKR